MAVTAHTGLNFDESYVARLTGAAAVLRCFLRESLDCSGRRIVVAPTAADVDVFQRCGWQSGRRVIAGEVVATDETTALAWIKLQRVLPMSAAVARAGAREELPMKLSFEPEFIDLDSGVARTGSYGTAGTLTANFKLLKATFEFTEVLEQLTVPAGLD